MRIRFVHVVLVLSVGCNILVLFMISFHQNEGTSALSELQNVGRQDLQGFRREMTVAFEPIRSVRDATQSGREVVEGERSSTDGSAPRSVGSPMGDKSSSVSDTGASRHAAASAQSGGVATTTDEGSTADASSKEDVASAAQGQPSIASAAASNGQLGDSGDASSAVSRDQSDSSAQQSRPSPSSVEETSLAFVKQLKVFSKRTFKPTDPKLVANWLTEVVDHDCSSDFCSNVAGELQFEQARNMGHYMQRLVAFLSLFFTPGVYDLLSSEVSERLVYLARQLLYLLCPWLPRVKRLESTWPQQPSDLLPPEFRPSAGRGVCLCVERESIVAAQTMLHTFHVAHFSRVEVEVVLFNIQRSDPAIKAMVGKSRLKVETRFLQDVFPWVERQDECRIAAALFSKFREVAILDPSTTLLEPPEKLFELSGFVDTGAAFFRYRPHPIHPEAQNTGNVKPWPYAFLSTLIPGANQHSPQLHNIQDSSVVVLHRDLTSFGCLGAMSLLTKHALAESQQYLNGVDELFWIGFKMVKAPFAFSRWLGGGVGFPKPSLDKEMPICGPMLQFDDAGEPLFWKGFGTRCAVGESLFDERQGLPATHFARVPRDQDLDTVRYVYEKECTLCLVWEDRRRPLMLDLRKQSVARDAFGHSMGLAKELPPAPAVSLSAPRSTAAPPPPIAVPSPSQPAPKQPTRSQSRSGDHQIPSVEQYEVLKYFRTDYNEALSANDVAKSLQAAIDRDCQNSDVSCLLPDPSASSPSAASVAATMRALASFLTSIFVPEMMLALESLDDELPGRVASLARALLHGVLPWLPKVPRHSIDWPTTFSDLLPPTLRPELKSKGVVMCVTAETREAVRSLIYNLRMSLVSQLPIEIFYVDDQDAPTGWRGTLMPYGLKSIAFRSLKATFRHVSDSELCRPLAALTTRFQQFVLLDTRVVVLQPPESWFFHLQPTGPGALFFRDRFLTGDGFPNPYSYFVSMQPRKLSPKHAHFEKDFSHLHHIQDASAVVLDRSRADLGVVGVVALVGHSSTREAARKAFPGTGEMWWIGFELLRAQFDFSFWLGGSVGRYVVIPEPGRSRPQAFVCGKMIQFDDMGNALYWTDGLDFPVCSGAGVQDRYWTTTERHRLRDGAPMIRPSAYDPETVEYRELSCGWCARIRHPGSLAVAVRGAGSLYMDVLARQKYRLPAPTQALVGLATSKQINPSAQFPSKHQLQALQLTAFSPAEIGKAAEADCQHGSNAPCSKLKLSRRAYAATPTVHDLGASMRSFQRFAASLFEPDMKIKLAAVRPSLPEEAAALTRNIMHALCPWLPKPDKGLGTWPQGPMDLFPEVLHPSAGRGVVACVGSRILPHFLVVLRTLRFQFQSDIPVELFYFDDNDLKPSDREMLRANYTNMYFSSLEDAFPRLLYGGFTEGWDCKVFAALASRFREVALLDSDLVLLREPAALFELPGFSEHGAAFFRDRNIHSWGTNPFDVFLKALPGGTNDIQPAADRLHHLQDSSVVVLDRVRVIMGLFGTASLMGHDRVRDETQRSCLGDKELFWIGFSMMNVGYTFSPWLAGSLGEVREDAGVCGHMVQFDKAGNILFWNSGFAQCDHREAGFSPYVVLPVKHLLRRKASDLSLSHEYRDTCGWCSKESRREPPPSSAPEDVAAEIAMVAQNVTSLAQEVFRAYGLMPPTEAPTEPPTEPAAEPPTQAPTEAPTAPSTDGPTPTPTQRAAEHDGTSPSSSKAKASG